MRNRLTYYSVALLVGLGLASGLILTLNPFGQAPASASQSPPPATASGATASGGGLTTAPSSPFTAGGGSDVGSQYGAYGHFHHHDSDFPGLEGGNAPSSTTSTTTTTTTMTSSAVVYSAND